MNLTEEFAKAVIASSTHGDYDYTSCNHCSAFSLESELTAPHDESCVVLKAYKYLQIPVPVPD